MRATLSCVTEGLAWSLRGPWGSRLRFILAGTGGLAWLALAGCSDPVVDNLPVDTGLLGVSLGKVAVVTGDFDRVEELLTAMQVSYTLYDGFILGPPEDAPLQEAYEGALLRVEQLLTDADALGAYNVLFLNCGIRGLGQIDPLTLEVQDQLVSSPQVTGILRDWVENGGNLLASDQSYTLVEAAFPELIDFQGDDASLNAALVGARGTLSAVPVAESPLQSLEVESLPLTLDVSRWAMPLPQDGAWLEAEATLQKEDGSLEVISHTPLLIQQKVGYGLVTFTSFHNLPASEDALAQLQLALLRSLGDAP